MITAEQQISAIVKDALVRSGIMTVADLAPLGDGPLTEAFVEQYKAKQLQNVGIQHVLKVLEIGQAHPAWSLAVDLLTKEGKPELPVAFCFEQILHIIHSLHLAEMRGFFVLRELARQEETCVSATEQYGAMFAQQAQAYLHSRVRGYGLDDKLSGPILSDPDWDNKFKYPVNLERLLSEVVQIVTCGKEKPDAQKGWSFLVPTYHNGKPDGTFYGVRIQIGWTTTPGLRRFSVHLGYFHSREDTFPYITEYRADFIPPMPEGQLDMRDDKGEFGLSIDAVRAQVLGHTIHPLGIKKVSVQFEIIPESIIRDESGAVVIRFPNMDKFKHLPEIEQKRYYLELASRAIFYRCSLGLKMELPVDIPVITPEEAQIIFEQNPGLYPAFVEKLRGAIYTNAGEAWKLMKILGITGCSKELQSLTEEQYRFIQGALTSIANDNIEQAKRGVTVVDSDHGVFPVLVGWLQAFGIELVFEEDWRNLFRLFSADKVEPIPMPVFVAQPKERVLVE